MRESKKKRFSCRKRRSLTRRKSVKKISLRRNTRCRYVGHAVPTFANFLDMSTVSQMRLNIETLIKSRIEKNVLCQSNERQEPCNLKIQQNHKNCISKPKIMPCDTTADEEYNKYGVEKINNHKMLFRLWFFLRQNNITSFENYSALIESPKNYLNVRFETFFQWFLKDKRLLRKQTMDQLEALMYEIILTNFKSIIKELKTRLDKNQSVADWPQLLQNFNICEQQTTIPKILFTQIATKLNQKDTPMAIIKPFLTAACFLAPS